MSHKINWEKIKEWYVEGMKDKEGNVTYPTLSDVAKRTGVKADSVRQRAARGGWTKLRKHFISKVDNLRKEKKSEILAGESAELDSETLDAAFKGIRIINAELDKAGLDKPPENGTTQEAIDWMLARKAVITQLGKALNDYHGAGRKAMGETEPPMKVELDAKEKLISAIDRIASRKTGDSSEPKPD